MGKFSKDTAATEVAVEQPTNAAQEAPASEAPRRSETLPAVRQSDNRHAINFNQDNIGFEDIRLPRLNLVQNVGQLRETFTPGEFVFESAQVIHSPKTAQKPTGDEPLNVVVLGFRATSFVEKIEGGERGKVCRTTDEVVACGGTLDYGEWDESVKQAKANPNSGLKPLRRFDYMTTALILIEKPEKVVDPNHNRFPYKSEEGKFYALVLYTMKGSAYNNGVKSIKTHVKQKSVMNDNVNYSDDMFTLTSKFEKYRNGGSAFIPVYEAGSQVSEALSKLVNRIKGQAS